MVAELPSLDLERARHRVGALGGHGRQPAGRARFLRQPLPGAGGPGGGVGAAGRRRRGPSRSGELLARGDLQSEQRGVGDRGQPENRRRLFHDSGGPAARLSIAGLPPAAGRATAAHPKFFLFDAGVFRSFRPRGPRDRPEGIEGAALEGLVAQHLRAWAAYAASEFRLVLLAHSFRRRGGSGGLWPRRVLGAGGEERHRGAAARPPGARGLRGGLPRGGAAAAVSWSGPFAGRRHPLPSGGRLPGAARYRRIPATPRSVRSCARAWPAASAS